MEVANLPRDYSVELMMCQSGIVTVSLLAMDNYPVAWLFLGLNGTVRHTQKAQKFEEVD